MPIIKVIIDPKTKKISDRNPEPPCQRKLTKKTTDLTPWEEILCQGGQRRQRG